MEFVKVQFEQDTDVYIDGQRSGTTNTSIRVEAGTHDFAVGDADSSPCPPSQQISLPAGGTTVVTPRIILFPAAA